MKKSTFGAPKPLPGEAGHKKEKASEVLEKETKEMEIKLKMLQERMLHDAMMNKAVSKQESVSGNGNKWNSSREDKGSFTSYAKDLQDKYKKQTSNIPMSSILSGTIDPAIKATANARRANRQQNNNSNNNALVDFRDKNVEDWTVDDVSSWLDSILLSQHINKFVSNAINGPILLDISLNDLDYMGITVLGHRKVLLKGIEDLRINKKVTIKLAAPSVATTQSKSPDSIQSKVAASTNKAISSLRSHDTNDGNKVHWSHLEPISTNKIEGNGKLMINPADSDVFDEEAEREAFKAAVMEWRGGNPSANSANKTNIVSEEQINPKKQDSSMWHNPFGTSNPRNNDASFDDSGDEDSNIITDSSGKSLLNGALDEEIEHAAFVKAVDAWRSGSNAASSSKVLSLADQISQQLDSDLNATSNKYNQQKEELLLAAAKRKDNINPPENKVSYSKEQYPSIIQCDFTDDVSDDDDDFLYTSRSNIAEEKYLPDRPNTGTVIGVSFVESALLDSKDNYSDESNAYIVEEYSDDEK